MKKIEALIIIGLAIVGLYYMTALATAYHDAVMAYYDLRHAQIVRSLR